MENNVTKLDFKAASSVYTVETTEAPQAIGPYVQGKVVNGFLYASGQIALAPTTGELVEFNHVYESFFANEKPSRSCVEVARLPKNVLIEVEIVAVVN